MSYRFDTQCVHLGTHPDPITGALSTPIYQTSTFAFHNADEGARRFKGEEEGYIYTRLGNPNHTAVEEKIAALEGGEAAAVAASGMGAIASVMWTALSAGDHVIAAKSLYGCTHALMNHQFPRFGMEATFMDLKDLAAVKAAMRPNTRMIYCESPANPTMEIADLEGLARIAHEGNAILVVDNTYCTPVIQRPLEFGADVVVHSATKYLNGHGDIIAGVIVGSKEFIGRIKLEGLKDLTGATLSPFDSYLLLRGMKTLHIRVPRHCETALKVARFLNGCPEVEKVWYPGLDDFPQRELADKQMKYYGAMIAMELKGGYEAGKKFINSTKLWTLAVSLGDAESLVQHPASMTHSALSDEELEKAGISKGLVRLSVGLEDVEDLIDDLKEAFAVM
ncbi:trans-sulfuration enzyme family protein [Aminobacterium colombiense]|jgi:methionine-gamma-lyase|uniref:Methionine gamma-lyase n=1 Tax=Aminobacterium colombiense (strain DSM 12261 / ALA-1) TaxID=572547 RepID=D5EDH0_AMICL|nr:aminotransferase class I/II-fold pyridoxal phosphate-dependent enzyme [Aminobacterium colombiense]ADE56602.1 Methionine gamma-lyase [Aminobacterium colombiense DSM 12261]MDD2379921.1 aminotransferase class I/II-fold pyridoxal phosphate-dependent enzyme [Aminobacterium colombiense]MDD4266411.1 aminotransferase class I/II-fold pyridoxal phosphate-dependent enzyme [Aminobacterium colombiense]